MHHPRWGCHRADLLQDTFSINLWGSLPYHLCPLQSSLLNHALVPVIPSTSQAIFSDLESTDSGLPLSIVTIVSRTHRSIVPLSFVSRSRIFGCYSPTRRGISLPQGSGGHQTVSLCDPSPHLAKHLVLSRSFCDQYRRSSVLA